MFGLPPFQYQFEVWRRTDCVLPPTQVAGETTSLAYVFDPPTNLRVYSSVGCTVTLIGNVNATYFVNSEGVVTNEVFSNLFSVVCSTSTTLSLYAVDSSHASRVVLVSLGQVLGAIFGKRRFLAVDEFGRIGTLEGQAIVCSTEVELRPGDILKTPDGIWYEAMDVSPAYDEHYQLHHYELTVEAITEDRLRLQ